MRRFGVVVSFSVVFAFYGCGSSGGGGTGGSGGTTGSGGAKGGTTGTGGASATGGTTGAGGTTGQGGGGGRGDGGSSGNPNTGTGGNAGVNGSGGSAGANGGTTGSGGGAGATGGTTGAGGGAGATGGAGGGAAGATGTGGTNGGGGAGGAMACGEGSGQGETCNTISGLTNGPCVVTAMNTSQTAPTPQGGQVAGGTYWLTSSTFYGTLPDSGSDDGDLGTRRETFLIYVQSGTSFNLDQFRISGTQSDSEQGSVAISGTMLTYTQTCPAPGDGGNNGGNASFTADGTSFTVFMNKDGGTLVRVYTKQP